MTESAPVQPAPASQPSAAAPRRKYVRAVGPRLRIVLFVVFALVALLGANSMYLAGVTALEWVTGHSYQDYFYQYMFLIHLVLGLLLILPFLAFGFTHMWVAKDRRNRRAVRIGYALLITCLVVLGSGLLLMRVGAVQLQQPLARSIVYWLHVGAPLAALWLYWLHRLAGPRIKWRVGLSYAGAVVAVVLAMVWLQSKDPRKWHEVGPDDGVQYFEPSLARTASGNFIPAEALMNEHYCMRCHQDIYDDWFHSAHRFSSFNNPAYLSSVRETREMGLERDGHVQASRWCAGCHDPVPFFSGAFDDPEFDMANHPTAHAGITCTVCHAITHVNSTRGNADYTIEEPMHYPFAFSDNPLLQYVNNQLVKAKPQFHKDTFLKPFHQTAEFCSVCHKVHLPFELNHYREFLRGQNHYDSYLLSGVSGHGARSFYYPPKAEHNCNECHMPLRRSDDFGARQYAGFDGMAVHNHMFPSANTGVAWFKNLDQVVEVHREFLQDIVRVDIFGVKQGGTIDGTLHAPLRPEVPALRPGETYLLETVVRTLKLGHHFTQGTVDSNEVWLDVTITSGDRVIGRSGGLDDEREVDPWSHFINVFMLDRDGNRIDRRNPQDIFVPLYNHQIPPGAGQTVHYSFQLPEDVSEPIRIDLQLQYRKFDKQYVDFIARDQRPGDPPLRGYTPGEPYHNPLPIVTMATDSVVFPLAGFDHAVHNDSRDIPEWQRWNDYGIGLLLQGRAQLRQAADAFAEVEKLGRYDGPLNLARVLFQEGRLDEAVDALNRALEHDDPPAPPWTAAWLSGQVNREQGYLEEAERNFRSVLEGDTPEMRERGFDFSKDYEVINLLGQTLFDRAQQLRGEQRADQRQRLLRQAVETFHRTLALDSENVTAHYGLSQLYQQLGDRENEELHRRLHQRYKPDDNARDRAVSLARQKYPAANHAAESLVIYSLQRRGAPELPADVGWWTSGRETAGHEGAEPPATDAPADDVARRDAAGDGNRDESPGGG